MHVAVIGGGAIGATLAYFLSRRGIRVTLFEKNAIGGGASFGNAGLLVPSYSAPLAAYANLIEGMRSLVGAPSAVHLKLRPDAANLWWIARFLAAAWPASSARGLRALASLTQRSLDLYGDLLGTAPPEVAYAKRGTMYVARSDEGLNESVKLAERLATFGIRSERMTAARAHACEPTLSSSIAGAVWYPEDAKVQPLGFARLMWDLAAERGAKIRLETVTGIAREGKRATGVLLTNEHVAADWVVLAAGSWSPAIVGSIGLRVPILPAKGYSFDLRLAHSPQTPMLFLERHVSVTPLNGIVRATTGLDFHGLDAAIAPQRLQAMRAAYHEYLDSPVIVEESQPWAGFRPLTPDGLPIVGPSSRVGNLLYATGHGPLGVTLAPATAELVTNMLLDEAGTIDPAMAPSRFGI